MSRLTTVDPESFVPRRLLARILHALDIERNGPDSLKGADPRSVCERVAELVGAIRPRIAGFDAEVARKGWVTLTSEEVHDEGNFAYTTGLWKNFHHPEVIVSAPSSLSPDSWGFVEERRKAVRLANRVAAAVKRGRRFEVGRRYKGLRRGVRCEFVPVGCEEAWYFLNAARRYYAARGRGFDAVQCVWPDKKGVFPWEDWGGGCDEVCKDQAVLAGPGDLTKGLRARPLEAWEVL